MGTATPCPALFCVASISSIPYSMQLLSTAIPDTAAALFRPEQVDVIDSEKASD